MNKRRNEIESDVSESYVISPYPTVVIVTTAHQNASGIDLKKLFSLPASAKYTAEENSTTPLRTSTHRRSRVERDTLRAGARRASEAGAGAGAVNLPHIAVSDSRYCNESPPESAWNRLKVAVWVVFISNIHSSRKNYHSCEHKLIIRCSTGGVPPSPLVSPSGMDTRIIFFFCLFQKCL